jgi:hypothetical protein
MPTHKPRRSRAPKPNRLRALELLAGSPDGMTEAMLLAHGFTIDMLVDLIRAGLPLPLGAVPQRGFLLGAAGLRVPAAWRSSRPEGPL